MFVKIIQYALKNILRNTFLSISSVLVLTLLMVFINVLLVIQSISFQIIESVNSKLTISLYINDKFEKSSVEVSEFFNSIKKFSSTVEAVYKTKAELLSDIAKQDPELVRILERTNPLPDTIELSHIRLDEYSAVNDIIQGKLFLLANAKDSKDSFSNYTSQYQRIEKIILILSTLQAGLYIIIAVFLLSIAVIVYSVIGNFVYYFKDEIYITRLVWGANLFVYWPFIVQGVLYAILSFCVSTFIFFFLMKNIAYIFDTTLSFSLMGNTFITLLWELGLFSLIGAISGYLSSKRYLTSGK